MKPFESLEDYLNAQVGVGGALPEVAQTILAIVEATKEIAALVRRGPLAGSLGAARGGNSAGDVQKELDILANNHVVDSLRTAPILPRVRGRMERPNAG